MSPQSAAHTYKEYLEKKYRRLVEEAYNVRFTDMSESDILTFEASQIDLRLKFLQL